MNKVMDVASWKKLFVEAGIEEEDAAKYAGMFVAEKLTRGAINQLDRGLLKEIGISTIGHCLAILNINRIQPETVVQDQVQPTGYMRAKPPPAKPPHLGIDITQQQFRKFSIDWKVFVDITSLPENHYHAQLYSCCDDQLQTTIINTYPDFFNEPMEDLLVKLEKIVTQRSNPTVHRMKFAAVNQANDESIQAYVSRLKATAQDCNFLCPGCQYNLSDMNVRDQLIRGLYNEAIQTDTLAKADQLDTLDKVIKHCEAFETALRDQSILQDVSEVNAARSSYKKKQAMPKMDNKQNKPCTGCGSKNHTGMERSSKCPAWGKECAVCHKRNHFSKVCRYKNQNTDPEEDIECLEALIAHLSFDKNSDTFTSNSGPMTEEISATLTAFTPNKDPRDPDKIPIHSGKRCRIFPDSGASICIAGPRHLENLGLSRKHLIPSKKIVRAVGGFKLTCQGWIPMEFQVGNHCTKQALYICEKVDRIYFSRDGCIDIGILPPTFPHPMEESIHQLSVVLNSPNKDIQTYQVEGDESEVLCRHKPPPRPDSLPFLPTEENIPKLKEYIINEFGSSAFNTTGEFPVLTGPKAHIHIKNDAIPFARHTPNAVPLHLKEATKRGIDDDVRRKIITPVPVGSPVEWCTTMVVEQKKTGKVRRTIDFQKLNEHCMRETHHTDSPFKLACQVPPHTYKTVLDAVDGYHSVLLDEESQPLTTFLTEWGRYQYLRMPQGFLASGDAYTRRYDEIIKDVNQKIKIVDDSLLWDCNIEESFYHTWDYLKLCAENGIVFNKEKFQFCQKSVEYAGLQVTDDGVSPSDKILKSIKDFPVPKNITDAQSWFGLVNQVAWAYSLAPIMQPF